MYACFVDGDGHREPQRVNHDLVFPPFYLLVAVDATLLVHMLGGLGTPGVYDAEARALRSSKQNAQLLSQRVHDVLKDTFAPPLRKVIEHKVVWQNIFFFLSLAPEFFAIFATDYR